MRAAWRLPEVRARVRRLCQCCWGRCHSRLTWMRWRLSAAPWQPCCSSQTWPPDSPPSRAACCRLHQPSSAWPAIYPDLPSDI